MDVGLKIPDSLAVFEEQSSYATGTDSLVLKLNPIAPRELLKIPMSPASRPCLLLPSSPSFPSRTNLILSGAANPWPGRTLSAIPESSPGRTTGAGRGGVERE